LVENKENNTNIQDITNKINTKIEDLEDKMTAKIQNELKEHRAHTKEDLPSLLAEYNGEMKENMEEMKEHVGNKVSTTNAKSTSRRGLAKTSKNSKFVSNTLKNRNIKNRSKSVAKRLSMSSNLSMEDGSDEEFDENENEHQEMVDQELNRNTHTSNNE
jgi:hypothetical protein